MFWTPLARALAVAAQFIAPGHPPVGQVIPSLPCAIAAQCSYALYLPKGYTPERSWPLLLGFHYEGDGTAIVERYRAAADRFGYIVAASNDSRNGNWAASTKVAKTMADDVTARFAVDPARVYLTGLSGGSRLALQFALTNKSIAGVIASSAGFADLQPRSSLRFPVFATVGRLDFNYIEMRHMTDALKSPHRLAVFDGGHVLPPDDVAMRAIEWLELQAMASGLRPRDESLIADLWAGAMTAIADAGETPQAVRLIRDVAADFRPFLDVGTVEARGVELQKIKAVKAGLDSQRQTDRAEADLVDAIVMYEVGLAEPEAHDDSFVALRSIVSDLRRRAAAGPSADRDLAVRVLDLITYAPSLRVRDRQYLAFLESVPQR